MLPFITGKYYTFYVSNLNLLLSLFISHPVVLNHKGLETFDKSRGWDRMVLQVIQGQINDA